VVRSDRAQAAASGEASYRLQATGTQTHNFIYPLTDSASRTLVPRDAPVTPSTIDRLGLSRMTAADVSVTPH